MALISDTLHMVQNLLLYYLLNLTQKVKTLTHSLRPHDPISFLWLQYCLHFHSLFLFPSPQVSYLVCFQPQMYTKITITKNEKCTQILFQFFFFCVEPWTLKYHLHQPCWQMVPITRHPHSNLKEGKNHKK